MRVILLALLLATAGLAGCLGSEDRPLEPSRETDGQLGLEGPIFPNGTAAPLGHEIRECDQIVHVQRAPADVFEGRMPPGFTMVTGDPAGELAMVLFVGQACTWMDGSEVEIAKAYVIVDPPDAWELAGASSHGLYLTVITTSQDLADLLAAWGLGPVVSVGDVSMETTLSAAGVTGHLDAAADGISLTIDTVGAGKPEAFPERAGRMFVADETLTVTGALDFVSSQHGEILQGASRVSFSGFAPEGPLPAYPARGHLSWGVGQMESYVELPELECGCGRKSGSTVDGSASSERL